jgi:hypothetical protein
VQQTPTHWKKWLPLAELWYNSNFHSALGCSPFQALYSYELNMGVLPDLNNHNKTHSSVAEMLHERADHITMLKNQLVVA